mgnify:CR=1 FL=1
MTNKYLQINKTQSIQQEVFEAHPFSILIYSIETLRILNVNQTAVLNYGYSKEEFSQMDITNLHDPKDRLMITKHIELVKKGTSKVKKWSHIKKNGDVAIVKITGVTIEFENEPEDLENFATKIDASMQAQNIYYFDLIKGKVLRPLIIRKVNKIKANFKRYKQRKIFLSIIKAVKIIQPFFRRRLVKV